MAVLAATFKKERAPRLRSGLRFAQQRRQSAIGAPRGGRRRKTGGDELRPYKPKRQRELINFILFVEVAEGADVGDYQGQAELIFIAQGAEGQARVFDGEAAAGTVVADLHEFVLHLVQAEIVAVAERGVPSCLLYTSRCV